MFLAHKRNCEIRLGLLCSRCVPFFCELLHWDRISEPGFRHGGSRHASEVGIRRRAGAFILVDESMMSMLPPPDGLKEVTIESLLSWIKDNLIKERPEMFLKEKSVRPGVLELVDDSDWELCGRLETVLEDNDEVIFISTLHGG